MPLNILNTLKTYHQYLTEKYGVHSSNLAKSDVPGAKGETLEDFQNVLQRTLRTKNHPQPQYQTHAKHFSFPKNVGGQFEKVNYEEDAPIANMIDTKTEMHEINNIMHEHKKVTNLYRKLVSIWHKNTEI